MEAERAARSALRGVYGFSSWNGFNCLIAVGLLVAAAIQGESLT